MNCRGKSQSRHRECHRRQERDQADEGSQSSGGALAHTQPGPPLPRRSIRVSPLPGGPGPRQQTFPLAGVLVAEACQHQARPPESWQPSRRRGKTKPTHAGRDHEDSPRAGNAVEPQVGGVLSEWRTGQQQRVTPRCITGFSGIPRGIQQNTHFPLSGQNKSETKYLPGSTLCLPRRPSGVLASQGKVITSNTISPAPDTRWVFANWL